MKFAMQVRYNKNNNNGVCLFVCLLFTLLHFEEHEICKEHFFFFFWTGFDLSQNSA